MIVQIRRALSLLCLIMLSLLIIVSSVCASAETEGKTVRVGWYDSSFNTMDSYGHRSGYGYEYQLKIAAYTGWKYEYVNGSWPQLLQMLENGQIDLLSDVSYTEEREDRMLFPSLPMGSEEFYLFIDPENREITQEDPSSLNGKRVGVNQGSIQKAFYLEWSERYDVQSEIVEVMGSEEESIRMLADGTLDAYVTVDFFEGEENLVPLFKIGSADFYFAVNRERQDLLYELNSAMSRIQDENRFYNQQMFEKHIRSIGANAFLTKSEIEWLNSHGTIRVGYQDNYLAFCAKDETTGELTGAVNDFLWYAADCMANAHLDFETRAFSTVTEAMDALNNGEIDCVFPANFSGYDSENMNVLLTPALINTEVYAVVRQSDQKTFAKREHVIVAVNEGNLNYDAFLQTQFPTWRRVYYPATADCLKAVADGVADCVLISNYRYNNIARLCDKYRLTTFITGADMDYCFVVGSGKTALYSILAKTIAVVPDSTVNAALSYYITEDARLSLTDFIEDNLVIVLSVIGVFVVIITALLVQNMRAARRARHLISATETDGLTGLYNRDFFFQYADRMYREHPETHMDAIVLNIEQFHSVNALNGRLFGDHVLRALGSEIRDLTGELGGIAGRFEADRFDIYCRHTDDYQGIFDRLQTKLNSLAPYTSLRLRMGVMPWQSKLEPVQLFDRARTACTMARGHYKEHLIVFDDRVSKREIYEQRLLNDLRRALDSYEFEVYYQPKYDIQSEPPRLVSAEALIRWHHSELGMIPPDDFIPLFERNGQIGAVDKYVWSEAARQIVRWREQYGVTIPISVNLSRVDVFDPMLEKTLDDVLMYNGLDHKALKLEVTESAYTENAGQVIRVVKDLRRKGYEVEMDDFGTGYSSLNMLSDMPIDVLKMDRAFIRNIEHNEKDIQLVALILGIAKNLRIPVVAEGVETEEQMQLLRNLGCELVQGYYFSRPLHAADFEKTFIRNMAPDAN